MIFVKFDYIILYKDEIEQSVACYSVILEVMPYILFEQVYMLFIYILFFELAIVAVVAIALFVALIVTVRKLNNKKYISARP